MNARSATTSVVISGVLVSSSTSCSAAIHHSAATVDKSVAGIVAIIAKDVKNYCLNLFVKVLSHFGCFVDSNSHHKISTIPLKLLKDVLVFLQTNGRTSATKQRI